MTGFSVFVAGPKSITSKGAESWELMMDHIFLSPSISRAERLAVG